MAGVIKVEKFVEEFKWPISRGYGYSVPVIGKVCGADTGVIIYMLPTYLREDPAYYF